MSAERRALESTLDYAKDLELAKEKLIGDLRKERCKSAELERKLSEIRRMSRGHETHPADDVNCEATMPDPIDEIRNRRGE